MDSDTQRSDAMKADFFILCSLSRCGSTALCRALNCHREIRCLFEPDFSTANWNEAEIRATMRRLRVEYSGIKHVWDPSGFPFVADHQSAVDAMNRDRERVLRANETVLSFPNSRAIFMRRRDQLARVLSDLLGQQTGLWGPITPDGRVHPQRDETIEYRSALANRPIRPVPVDVVEWYLNHVAKMEDYLRTAIDHTARLDLPFEDIMGDGVPLAARLEAYCGVLDFLGFPSAGHYWDIMTVRSLLRPSARLNDAATLGRIPNLADIQSRFGHLFISDRA